MAVYRMDIGKTTKEIYSGHLRLGADNLVGKRISLTNYYIELDGKPWIPVMGEFHYSRFPNRYWEEEILKIKAGGVDIISTYVFWNHHEEEEGAFDWSMDRNLRCFAELCRKHDMLLVVRMGPFCHGEVRNGGIPDWLYARPFQLRSNEEGYIFYVKRLYQEISAQLCGLLHKDGGPVIGIQLENEFMHSGAPWEVTYNKGVEWVTAGSDGEEHMKMLKKLAIDAGIDVPLYTCTAWGSPVVEDEYLPMFGGYAFYAWENSPDQKPSPNYVFADLHKKGSGSYDESSVPFACCEMGGGMQVFYQNRPVVPARSVEAMTVTKLASGSNILGYYMYHGGSNPLGKHGFLNEYRCPRISYDFQAPIREFGQLSETYKCLKRMFLFLHECGEILAPMATVLSEETFKIASDDTSSLRWAVRTDGKSGFVFLNNYQDHVKMKAHENIFFSLNTDGEKIEFPRENGLTLSEGCCAVLPFNLSMEGAILKYSTAQLLTRIKDNGTVYYFFFTPDDIKPEFAFEEAGLEEIRSTGGTVEKGNKLFYVAADPGIDNTISITTTTGMKVVITTLTHKESLHFWKGTVRGKERVMLSEAGLLIGKNGITMNSKGGTSMDFLVCPHEDCSFGVRGGKLSKIGNEGVFEKYSIEITGKAVNMTVKRMGKDNAVIHFDRSVLDEISDLFLEIEYIGDIGETYLDGKLISDNFCNRTVWEIGLKRFMPHILESELFVHVTPTVKPGDTAKVEYSDMAAIIVASPGEGIAEIKSIKAISEYRVELFVTKDI